MIIAAAWCYLGNKALCCNFDADVWQRCLAHKRQTVWLDGTTLDLAYCDIVPAGLTVRTSGAHLLLICQSMSACS